MSKNFVENQSFSIGLMLCFFFKFSQKSAIFDRGNPIEDRWFWTKFEENHRGSPIENHWFLAKFEEKP